VDRVVRRAVGPSRVDNRLNVDPPKVVAHRDRKWPTQRPRCCDGPSAHPMASRFRRSTDA
jgi:hypothetical protein